MDESGEIFTFRCEWKINMNEIAIEDTQHKLISPNFYTYRDNEDKVYTWYLGLYPSGLEDSSDGYMGLSIQNDNGENTNVACSLSLMTNNLKKISVQRFNTEIFDSREFYIPNFVPKNFLFDPVNEFIKDDIVTIVWTIRHKFNGDLIKNDENMYQLTVEDIFKNKKYNDVTIMAADGVEFFLHKCILATQSRVFESMFDTDMLEKKKNLVKINDFESSVLSAFFKYLYTGMMYKNQARDLLIIAEKYNVESLKELCQDIMCFDVNADNAVEYFKVALMYNANVLKNCIIRFIALNLRILIKKPEYKSLLQDFMIEITECRFKLFEDKLK